MALLLNICLWRFECLFWSKEGLAAGRYSGSNLPVLYLTPQALHSVFGPRGPILHCGVLSIWQWVQILFRNSWFCSAENTKSFIGHARCFNLRLLLGFFLVIPNLKSLDGVVFISSSDFPKKSPKSSKKLNSFVDINPSKKSVTHSTGSWGALSSLPIQSKSSLTLQTSSEAGKKKVKAYIKRDTIVEVNWNKLKG